MSRDTTSPNLAKIDPLSCQKSRVVEDFVDFFDKWDSLGELFPSDRQVGNKLDIFEMVTATLTRNGQE